MLHTVFQNLGAAISLLRSNFQLYLALPAIFYAVYMGLPYAVPLSETGVLIGGSIASCYLAMFLYAHMVVDLGGSVALSMREQAAKMSQSKAWVYLGFSIIYVFAAVIAASLAGGIVAGVGSFFAPDAVAAFLSDAESESELFLNTAAYFATLETGGYLVLIAIGLFIFLTFIAVFNILSTIWFITPPLMVAMPTGIGAMGESAKIVGQAFWSVYVLSFVGTVIYSILAFAPLFFIMASGLGDTWFNNAAAGLLQGVGLSFLIALSTLAWRQLRGNDSATAVFA